MDQVLGPHHDLTEFYTHASVRAAFRDYLLRLVNRVNSLTGVRCDLSRRSRRATGIMLHELECSAPPHNMAQYNKHGSVHKALPVL